MGNNRVWEGGNSKSVLCIFPPVWRCRKPHTLAETDAGGGVVLSWICHAKKAVYLRFFINRTVLRLISLLPVLLVAAAALGAVRRYIANRPTNHYHLFSRPAAATSVRPSLSGKLGPSSPHHRVVVCSRADVKRSACCWGRWIGSLCGKRQQQPARCKNNMSIHFLSRSGYRHVSYHVERLSAPVQPSKWWTADCWMSDCHSCKRHYG